MLTAMPYFYCYTENSRHTFLALTLLYFLLLDVESVPDVLWPNAKQIICSAVSRCTRYIALGLDEALVCVWDRQSGEQILYILIFV